MAFPSCMSGNSGFQRVQCQAGLQSLLCRSPPLGSLLLTGLLWDTCVPSPFQWQMAESGSFFTMAISFVTLDLPLLPGINES